MSVSNCSTSDRPESVSKVRNVYNTTALIENSKCSAERAICVILNWSNGVSAPGIEIMFWGQNNRFVAVLFGSLLVYMFACQPVTQIGIDPDDGAADADSDSDDDADGDSDICDALEFDIEVVPPRMMILLDGSPSMADNDKWDTATGAISDLVETWFEQIHFGFDVFPSSGNCNVDVPVVMDVDTSAFGSIAVIGKMPGGPTGGSTPLYCGIANFLDPTYAPVFSSTEVNSYLVVVSDGSDLCGKGCCTIGTDCRLPGNSAPVFAELATDLLNGDNPIMTFSIGLGEEDEEDLNAIASNGGTGFSQYFPAKNASALNAAFADIADQTVSCTYNFSKLEPGADRNQINVYFDNTVVGYDENCVKGKGWNWVDSEHTEIEFCEQACESLKSGNVSEVLATFGCETIVV